MIFSGLFVLLLLILVENVIAKTLTSRIRKNIKKILTSWAGIDRVSVFFIEGFKVHSIWIFDFHLLLLIIFNPDERSC